MGCTFVGTTNGQFFSRKILKFLIPVKLSIGVLPRRTLLEKYNLLEVYILVLLFTNMKEIVKCNICSCIQYHLFQLQKHLSWLFTNIPMNIICLFCYDFTYT